MGAAIAIASLLLLGLMSAPRPTRAAEPTGNESEIVDEMTVVGHRSESRWLETPASISIVHAEEIQRARQQLSLGESIGSMPGVWVQNQYNFAQDARISIRGFGARSPFGIRGIKLFVDEIPYTLPDGQGQVDSIDLSTADRIEVLRGPNAALYGSSSGGVIRIRSEIGGRDPVLHSRFAFGSYGYRNYQGRFRGSIHGVDSMLGISRLELDNYREHSRMENVLLNTNFGIEVGDSTQLRFVLNHLDAPTADDPGGLTRDEARSNPTMANPRNVAFDAGEDIDNTTLGVSAIHTFDEHHETTLSNYYSWRDFEGRIPSDTRGAIDLDRFFVGGRLKHVFRDELFGMANRLSGGVEAEGQFDDRLQRGIDSATGAPTTVSIDEDQNVTGVGVFLQDELWLHRDVSLSASVRYDWVRYEVDDHLVSDGDDSGELDYDNWSYAGTLLWSPIEAFNSFARVATSFDTPAATALAIPNGGGFNPDLEAQTAISYEIGFKGIVLDRLRYEASVFFIEVENELLPYRQNFSTFYENAARSERLGVETGLLATLHRDLELSVTYTWSDFEFDDFDSQDGESYDGNVLPGIPQHLVSIGLDYQHPWGFFANWSFQYVSDRYADNANSPGARADDYTLSNLRLGYGRALGSWGLEGFVGFNNLGDNQYIDNLRINDTNARYFEPAPDFNAYGGVSISYHFGANGRAGF